MKDSLFAVVSSFPVAARRAWYARSSAETKVLFLGSGLLPRMRACWTTWVTEIDADLLAFLSYPEKELETKHTEVSSGLL